MKCFETLLNGHKISKSLPKIWETADGTAPENEMFVLEDFALYAKRLYISLLGILKFYKDAFNEDNVFTIHEYIDLFNNSFDSFIDIFVSDKEYAMGLMTYDSFNGTSLNYNKRFDLLKNVQKNSDNFVFDEDGKVKGFTDSAYEKASKLAKQIFMIEKICSFTTRKFWTNEITKFQDLDLNKKYKILVKCFIPNGWRKDKRTEELNNYMKEKKYHSTSLIDQDSFYNTFLSFRGNYVLLLTDYDDKDFICACSTDDCSEEVIDGQNLLKDKRIFSDIFLQDEIDDNSKKHKFFAEAVECETPKNILNNVHLYSEVNLRNLKPKAVISPNERSLEFAHEVAKKYGDLPVILRKEKE